jgi:hypothetical protein
VSAILEEDEEGEKNYLIPVIAAEMKTVGSGLQRFH